ncbi:MAG: FKBP-type peptidyl-prolyl cis-trans isomerase [Parcubacteria group bacterium Gr01-1014_20]|nr:MAG: FKBP-type peptidyl-prolyl cis-trans isomerase [Parcubacteria group bacterium Gr01-1014_20]
MNKEKIIAVFVILVILVVLFYVFSKRNSPPGKLIQNLVNPLTEEEGELGSQILPGDEKLIKKDISVGSGAEAKLGDTVTVNYLGTLENGTKFDSSYDRKQPFSFVIGNGEVIRGWDIGVLGMKVGGKRELVIPPELAYGEADKGAIPPNSTLKFTIELLQTKNVDNQILNLNP